MKINTSAKHEYKYHTLPKAFKHTRFWKPILAFAIGTIIYLIAQTVFVIGSFFALGLHKERDVLEFAISLEKPMEVNLPMIFILFGSVAIMLPIMFLTLLITQMKPIHMVSSVELKIRWKYLFKSLVISGIFTTGLIVLGGFLDGSIYDFELPKDTNIYYWLGLAVLLLIIVPIQSAAEEYVFRGFIMQTLGGWFGSLIVAIGVTSTAFAFAHMYQKWAFISTLLFGIVCGYLVYVTGGLEASIAIHVTNNVVSVIYMLFVFKEFNPAESGDSAGALITVVQLIIISAILIKIAKKDKIKTSFTISENLDNDYVKPELKYEYVNNQNEKVIPTAEKVEESFSTTPENTATSSQTEQLNNLDTIVETPEEDLGKTQQILAEN